MSWVGWVCESCEHPHRSPRYIWLCAGCTKECCENCFDRYAHCKACSVGKSDEQLRLAANAAGFDFEPVAPVEAGVPDGR